MAESLSMRQRMIRTCRQMNAVGLNTGSSGNLSVRDGDGFLITPSGLAYEGMTPEQIVELDADGRYYGDFIPSSEWRFHYDILQVRRDVDAVLHAHSTYCTILACCRRDIPPIHYMIAVAGGRMIKCSGYAPFGTQQLSELALEALGPRTACLLGNHGVITLGHTPENAFLLLREVENLARIYIGTLTLGGGTLLNEAEMDLVLERFKTYGRQPGEVDRDVKERVEPPPYGGKRRG